MSAIFRRWKFEVAEDLLHMKKIVRDPVLLAAILLCIGTLFVFVVLPLYKVLQQSFFNPEGVFSFDAYFTLVSSGENLKAFFNTVMLGTIVGICSTAIGFLFAYCYTYLAIRGKKIFNLVAMLPMISPPFAVALSMILLFGSRGFVTHTLLGLRDSNIYGLKGLILVQTLSFFPIAYLLLAGMLKSIDPSIEDAARDLGASRWATFRRITAPLVMPGIANSFLLVFIKSVADFANPMAIGGNFATLATQIYIQSIGNYDVQGGAAVAVLLLDLSMLLFIISKYWVEKKVYITVTGKSSRERVSITDKIVVWPIAGICFAISFIVLALYILIPIGSFVKLWGINYSLTLDHYRYAFGVGSKAILDTTWLSLIATPVTGVLGMIIAFLIVRKRFIGKGFINFSSLLSIAVPGTVIGVGYILAFNTPPLVLTGTAFILVAAFVVRSLPVGIRAGVASLQQIDPSIDEAAADLGASSRQIFFKITLPMIKTAFFSGLIYTFIRSMTSISAVIFLITAKYNLITISVLDQVESAKFGVASAFSTILILIVYVAIFITNYLLSRMGTETKKLDLS